MCWSGGGSGVVGVCVGVVLGVCRNGGGCVGVGVVE